MKMNKSQREIELEEIVDDLTRRLQNAQHTIRSQKTRLMQSTRQAQFYRNQVADLSYSLTKEMNKNVELQRRKVKEEESKRYEDERRRCVQLQTDIRMALMDRQITQDKRIDKKVARMRDELRILEEKQDSEKQFLDFLVAIDELTDEMAQSAQAGDIEKCYQLLRCGASANAPDKSGFMPLYYACAEGHVETARLLLEFGADAAVASINLSKLAHPTVIELLAEYGTKS